jgi:hypothetical protein
MQFIISICKKYRGFLLSGLKIKNVFKIRKFYVTSGTDVYAIWNVYSFFLHWEKMTRVSFYEIKV